MFRRFMVCLSMGGIMLERSSIVKYPDGHRATITEPFKPRGGVVTVCIAAIAENFGKPPQAVIVGAADHMLTAGDIEFESPVSKIFRMGDVGSPIFTLMSGDAGTHSLINQVTQHALIEGTRPVTVKGAADAYARAFIELRRSIAET